MQGYVKNQGTTAYFICQRQLPPGSRITFDTVYTVVGKKSGLENNEDFIDWIKSNVFKRGNWGYYDAKDLPLGTKGAKVTPKKKTPVVKKKKAATPKKKTTSKTSSKRELDASGAGRAMSKDPAVPADGVTPSAIIEASYEHARGLIEKTKDRSVLKKALALTNHFSGKEQHMRHIIKRLEQVY